MTVQYPVAHSPLRTPATLVVAGLWTMSVLSVARVLLAWQTGPLVTLFSGVLTLGWLYTAATFMVWLYQARQALDRRGETGMRWATGWTIGGWFIPLANLVIPARVVAEVYARSAPGAVRGWQTPRLVVAWWFVFLLSVVHVTYRKCSGTGRSAERTTAVGRPVRLVRSSTNRLTSPSVADINRNCACGSSISGTCQAQPRSGSA